MHFHCTIAALTPQHAGSTHHGGPPLSVLAVATLALAPDARALTICAAEDTRAAGITLSELAEYLASVPCSLRALRIGVGACWETTGPPAFITVRRLDRVAAAFAESPCHRQLRELHCAGGPGDGFSADAAAKLLEATQHLPFLTSLAMRGAGGAEIIRQSTQFRYPDNPTYRRGDRRWSFVSFDLASAAAAEALLGSVPSLLRLRRRVSVVPNNGDGVEGGGGSRGESRRALVVKTPPSHHAAVGNKLRELLR